MTDEEQELYDRVFDDEFAAMYRKLTDPQSIREMMASLTNPAAIQEMMDKLYDPQAIRDTLDFLEDGQAGKPSRQSREVRECIRWLHDILRSRQGKPS